jgi:recombination protein RecR
MNPLERLIKALSRLPGIGEKTATRLALFILREKKGIAPELIQALTTVREKVKFCQICENLTEEELCPICKDERRIPNLICVIQEPVDLLMDEKTGEFRGRYHVLHGVLSPLDGIGPEELRIGSLIKRAQSGGIDEIILAMNPNSEGEATALYLKKLLSDLPIKVTRIASGVPVGGILEYTDPHTLSKALDNRREF